MMEMMLRKSAALILGAFMAFSCGCAGSKPTSFYILHSLPNSALAGRSENPVRDVAIGVGPIRIPDYLDRADIVVRTGESSLKLDEFNKWAEPLDKSLGRVIAENLSSLLNTDRIAIFPWSSSTQVRYQVAVEILQLDGLPGGNATLNARWTILSENGEKTLLLKRSSISTPVQSAGYEGIAKAESLAVEQLSREIAAAIRSIPEEPPAS